MITEKLIEKPWMFSRLWRAFVANNFTLGGGSYEPILYDDLVALIDGEDLVVGKKYLITDYKTTFTLNISATAYTDASVEGIVVTALTDASLEPIAYSISHPKDILYYDVDGTTYMPGSTKGCIYRRIDTEKNISVPFDFREFKVEVANVTTPNEYDNGVTYAKGDIVFNSSNIKISLQNSNTGNDGDALFWKTILDKDNDKTVSPFTFFNGTIGNGGTIEGPFELFSVGNSLNFVINNQPATISETLFKTYGYVTDCTFDAINNCVFKSEDPLFNNNCGKIKDCIFNGAVVSNSLAEITGLITGSFNNNTLAKSFNNNFIANAAGNNIAADFQNNIAGANFRDNTIRLRCQNNNFGNNFGNLADNYGNQIGNDFHNNVIGNTFSRNIIGNWFYNNIVGNDFQHNNLPFDFYSNTCNDDFQNWNGQCRLNGVNFNAVTTTPQDSKFIIRDNGLGDIRVGYWVNGVMTYQSF